MSSTTRVATAITAGYFLGRFKKLRLAIIVGSALANENVRAKGLGLLAKGGQGLTSSPEAKKLTSSISGPLAEAGRAAAMSVASTGINRLSDRLNERSELLRGEVTDRSDDEPEDDADQPEDEADEPEDRADDEPEDEDDEFDDEADEDEPEDEDEPTDEADEDEPEDEDEPTDEADEDEPEDEDEPTDEADEDEPDDEDEPTDEADEDDEDDEDEEEEEEDSEV
jgi:hypothetical protein